MFTIEQIKSAHAKVKSGADFPSYIRELKALGISNYSNYVRDGHTIYKAADNSEVVSGPNYSPLNIHSTSNQSQLEKILKEHQAGLSDYPTFCQQAADCGVEKWVVSTDAMTCVYHDKTGKTILEENIPAA